jgi:hypothetical protein
MERGRFPKRRAIRFLFASTRTSSTLTPAQTIAPVSRRSRASARAERPEHSGERVGLGGAVFCRFNLPRRHSARLTAHTLSCAVATHAEGAADEVRCARGASAPGRRTARCQLQREVRRPAVSVRSTLWALDRTVSLSLRTSWRMRLLREFRRCPGHVSIRSLSDCGCTLTPIFAPATLG